MNQLLAQRILNAFIYDGYKPIKTNIPAFSYFKKEENEKIILVCMLDDTLDNRILPEFLYYGMEQLVSDYSLKGYEVHSLGIYITNEIEKGKQSVSSKWNRWILEERTGNLIIYEDQPSDFFQVSQLITKAVQGKIPRKHIPLTPVNTILVIINILYFIVSEWCGGSENSRVMYQLGALQIGSFLEQKEWWRLITSGFLHFGFSHLINNMIVLLGLGIYVENILGKGKYLFLYMTSLMGANVISVLWYQKIGELYVLSAGASGAICGVVGALLYLAIKHKGRIETVTSRQLIYMILFTMFYGITSVGVNNSAHIGGLVIGFFLCMALSKKHSL